MKAKSGKKQLFLRIGVIAAIVIVTAGIFIVKNIISRDSSAVQNEGITYPLKLTKTDLQAIKAYGVPTVIDFGSDSCSACKRMASVLEALNTEWQGKAAVQFMDVWKYTDGVDDFPLSIIPTQFFFNSDGAPYVPSEAIQEEIEFTMYYDESTSEHVFTVHQGGITEEQMRKIFAEMGIE